jgi:heptosyltransferase-2
MRYRFIGDTLLTVPFLRNLRSAFPDARIDMLVGPASGEVLTHCPYVDELIYFDTTRKHAYENGKGKKQGFWHYVGELRKRGYDTAFILKRSFSSAALAFLAGISQRIGFDTEGRGFLLTHKAPYTMDCHEVDSFLSLLKVAELPVMDTHLESWWGPEEEEVVNGILAPVSAKKHYVVHVTSSNGAKEWSDARFAEVAQWLLTRDGKPEEVALHGLGATGDRPRYEALRALLPAKLQPRLHNWCGKTNLLESLAFLKRMDGVVGVDSGTLHMAAAVGTPVVALFGPMDSQKWRPYGEQHQVVSLGLPCQPCHLKIDCPIEFACMKELAVEPVINACKTL